MSKLEQVARQMVVCYSGAPQNRLVWYLNSKAVSCWWMFGFQMKSEYWTSVVFPDLKDITVGSK